MLDPGKRTSWKPVFLITIMSVSLSVDKGGSRPNSVSKGGGLVKRGDSTWNVVITLCTWVVWFMSLVSLYYTTDKNVCLVTGNNKGEWIWNLGKGGDLIKRGDWDYKGGTGHPGWNHARPGINVPGKPCTSWDHMFFLASFSPPWTQRYWLVSRDSIFLFNFNGDIEGNCVFARIPLKLK